MQEDPEGRNNQKGNEKIRVKTQGYVDSELLRFNKLLSEDPKGSPCYGRAKIICNNIFQYFPAAVQKGLVNYFDIIQQKGISHVASVVIH